MVRQQANLIFDLDGTLTDSKPGIVGCLQEVIDARHMGEQGPLDRFVGPPVEEWTKELLPNGSDDERVALASDYRACYDRVGWRNNSVFPGVLEMLAELRGWGHRLFVCTSKQQRFALRIVEHFELNEYFAAVYGDRAEFASHGKEDLLALLVREQALDIRTTWTVGDRVFDVRAAHANGIRCIAAGWGYGSQEELLQADAFAARPCDVAEAIGQPDQIARG